MLIYTDEKRRRIDQFAGYLRLMGLRRHKVVKNDDCFAVFTEKAPEDSGSPHVEESSAIKIDCLANGGSGSTGSDGIELPREGWLPAKPFRFIQFAFTRDCFYLELPNNTVFPNEAEQILQQRPGFYWARNRPDLRWVRANWKDIVEWDPLQKVYLYRDEQSAAEDMAFILFQVWKFPVDWRWYIRAAAFHANFQFEQGKSLD
jgi:hypothetical protein